MLLGRSEIRPVDGRFPILDVIGNRSLATEVPYNMVGDGAAQASTDSGCIPNYGKPVPLRA
jgi:hypothetical protein